MDNRPHSHGKTVGSGSASVGKGAKVGGSGPVGGGSRPGGSSGSGGGSNRPGGGGFRPGGNGPQRSGGNSGGTRSTGGGGCLGKLIIPIIIIIGILIFGGRSLLGGGSGTDYSSSGSSVSSSSSSTGDSLSSLLGGTGSTSSAGSSSSSAVLSSLLGSSTVQNTASSSADLTVSSQARDKYVTPKGDGSDTWTIMVYMCGTDLESKSAMATRDLQEMLGATISDKVNLIIETGGCKQWQNNVMSASTNQIYRVVDGKLQCLEKDLGAVAMTDPNNLTDFVKYCQKNYPADRNMLIMWDHGGGSLTGYGYDEKFANSSSMTLTKINSALKSAGCKFDIIGFDACLMATLETALVCNEYADYLIASEETEPGTGWYYTTWLNAISQNTSIPTVQLAQKLIDSYMQSTSGSKVTLSVIDLAELAGTVPAAFRDFAESTGELVKTDYTTVSNARAGTRQFAQSSKINQVDLIDLADRLGTDEASALAEALRGCIKYNGTTISKAYGVSIYFPYENQRTVGSAVNVYEDLGLDSEYADCIKSFASLSTGQQVVSSASTGGYTVSSSGGSDLLSTLLSAYAGSGSSSSSSYSSGYSTGASGSASALSSLLGGYATSSGSSASGTSLDVSSMLSLLSGFSGRSMPSGMEWVDTDLIADSAQMLASSAIDPSRITLTYLNGTPALSLTGAEWDLIQTAELNLYVDDGEGYIDLGLDNSFSWLDDTTMSLEWDGTWLTVNGQVCAFYLVSDVENDDGTWTTTGFIPALLNGESVRLQVLFADDNPVPVITGAWPVYSGETDTQAKGELAIEEGDEIVLLCDYYDYDGNYDASYELGQAFTVGADGLTLTYLHLSDTTATVSYRLTDIYGNCYWTPAYSVN